jgi:hypothetical protein
MRVDKVNEFFEFANERHMVYLRRADGKPRPWTHDPILDSWYFTNVYRELDKTTKWFRRNVRENLRDSITVLPATVLFRWFNRVDIAEYVFCQYDLLGQRQTLFDRVMAGDVGPGYVAGSIRNAFPKGPYVNGAYIIKGYDGMDKLTGVTQAFWNWFHRGWKKHEGPYPVTMEGMTRWLATFDQLGMFMGYEVACDLRHTMYLEDAVDVNLWANPGPGARRGLSRLWTDSPDEMKFSEIRAVEAMRKLLDMSRTRFINNDWEMREVEHTLCEFDKYERIRQGGRGKRVYR